jgi:DNA-directed RNA polymerase subunit RPC12/RpoP
MTEHLCSNCKEKRSTWYMDVGDRTWWQCSSCGFNIEEDESKETFCQKCNFPVPTVSYLMENDKSFYWCGFCGNRIDLS